ncbi:MAG: helix-turn-helix domain-containing protein [Saprospiraceae bacterium]|nr:helix-turn-helix domain-containing protein [Saprospiraceae bacterium]MDZ7878729.1 helix-turn-helix domain-containing protein [Saprospiraceae bacterium]
MSRKVSYITLLAETESSLKELLKRGTLSVRTYRRIQILLDLQTETPETIHEIRGVSLATVYNVKNQYLLEKDYKMAIYDAPRSGAPIKIEGKVRAQITAIACSDSPTGHLEWTLQMIADKAVEMQMIESISRSSVHLILKKTKFNRTAKPVGVWV